MGLLVTIATSALPGIAPARAADSLVAPVRCVGDYLEALAAAAPPRPRRAPAPPPNHGSEPRWARVRSYLAPRTAATLDATGRPALLAPWASLRRDEAFLGYELMAARRAPRGAAVVVTRERTERGVGAPPTSAACVYLVGKVSGAWRIADKRCGRDFTNREVSAGYPGYWDEPAVAVAGEFVDDWFGEDLE